MEDIGCSEANILPETDILLNLNALSDKFGIELTFTHKRFFLRLIELVSEDAGFQAVLTVDELASSVQMPVRTVSQCLNRLAACGAISNEPKTRPRTTRLNQKLFVKERTN